MCPGVKYKLFGFTANFNPFSVYSTQQFKAVTSFPVSYAFNKKIPKDILGRNLKFLVPWPKLYRLSEIENLSKRKTGFKVHLNFAYY